MQKYRHFFQPRRRRGRVSAETIFLSRQVDVFVYEKKAAQLRQLPILDTDHLGLCELADLHASMVRHG